MTPADQMAASPSLRPLMDELRAGLARFRDVAGDILEACGVTLLPGGGDASLTGNFFSLLFLYSYRRAGIPAPRRRLYAATLQCLRGMVTGCDNLLDDEYKPTLETDLPQGGHRFRSVVDIMVSDRALFRLLLDAAHHQELAVQLVPAAAAASMRTMTRSGIQEAEEETGITEILAPQTLLETIHHYKTGILFQCPWDIPRMVENVPRVILHPLLQGLYDIGMGCQILDDIVDLGRDIRNRRHNYVVSLVHFGNDAQAARRLARLVHCGAADAASGPAAALFPAAVDQTRASARTLLRRGLEALFAPADHGLVTPGIHFLEQRIGVPSTMGASAP